MKIAKMRISRSTSKNSAFEMLIAKTEKKKNRNKDLNVSFHVTLWRKIRYMLKFLTRKESVWRGVVSLCATIDRWVLALLPCHTIYIRTKRAKLFMSINKCSVKHKSLHCQRNSIESLT